MATKTGTPGADNLVGTDGDDTLQGLAGNDQLTGGKGADLLDGGAGTDTARYDGSATFVSVDLLLNTGFAGDAAGDTLLGVENATGSAFGDTIRGNNAANVLRGLAGGDRLDGAAGDDRLAGGAGADQLFGDTGADTADYSSAKAGVVASLLSGGLGGDAGGDTYSSVENLTGSAFADNLRGDAGANAIKAGGGDDFVAADAGADTLDGGTGVDFVDYLAADAGVTVDLGTGTASGDVISGFENVAGSASPDRLVGDGRANEFLGRGGDDTIQGGGGDDVITGGEGADTLDGGEGLDTLDYSFSTIGVVVDLSSNLTNAAGDTIQGFENLLGSSRDDAVFGTSGANKLEGNGGADQLVGFLGRDELTGGAGADLFTYGRVADSGITAGTRDVIHDFRPGADGDRIDLGFLDADAGKAGEQAFAFVGGNGFSAAGQVQFFFEGDHTVVALNTSGASGAESQIQLDGHLGLVGSDFLL